MILFLIMAVFYQPALKIPGNLTLVHMSQCKLASAHWWPL